MTPINIQAEYRVPVYRDIFEDCDFMPAETRDCSKLVNDTTTETDNSEHDAETISTSDNTTNLCNTRECELIQEGCSRKEEMCKTERQQEYIDRWID